MTTESSNPRSEDIDRLPTHRILELMNDEDALVAPAVRKSIPEIERIVDRAVEAIQGGGRVIYVGAGTSGRLGVLDAAECPPTFSSPPGWFQGVMAGGGGAVTEAREGVEDDVDQAEVDMAKLDVGPGDLLIGIAASGRTPYTKAALQHGRRVGAKTAAIVCADNSPIAEIAEVTAAIPLGPELLTGSTRLKAGTAQKLALNMISTVTMIRLGMTHGNLMINVAMTNDKLRARGTRIVQSILGITLPEAEKLVEASGTQLRVAVMMGKWHCGKVEAEQRLQAAGNNLRKALGDSD